MLARIVSTALVIACGVTFADAGAVAEVFPNNAKREMRRIALGSAPSTTGIRSAEENHQCVETSGQPAREFVPWSDEVVSSTGRLIFGSAIRFVLAGSRECLAVVQSTLAQIISVQVPLDHAPLRASKLDLTIMGYGLVRNDLPTEVRAGADEWLREVQRQLGVWFDDTAASPALRHRLSTNWNAHRIKVNGLIAFALDDSRLVEKALDEYVSFVDANIAEDGSSFDFRQRDALEYHSLDVKALLELALVFAANGRDLFGSQGATATPLRRSVDFIVPYCEGLKTHREFVETQVPGDRRRKAAKVGEVWRPGSQTRDVMSIAAAFDPAYRNVCGERTEGTLKRAFLDAAVSGIRAAGK